jgi:hypothetical protein
MKKFLSIAAAAMAMTSVQAANAQAFLTPGTYTYSGSVTVQKDSIALNCTLTADITNTSGVLTVSNISLSGGLFGLCASVTMLNQPYNATYSSPTLTILGFHPRAATNSTECYGDVELVQVPGTTDDFTINSVIPKISGSNDCVLSNGYISYP